MLLCIYIHVVTTVICDLYALYMAMFLLTTYVYRWPTPRRWAWLRAARTTEMTTWAPPLLVYIHAFIVHIHFNPLLLLKHTHPYTLCLIALALSYVHIYTHVLYALLPYYIRIYIYIFIYTSNTVLHCSYTILYTLHTYHNILHILYCTIHRLKDHQHDPQPCRRADRQCSIRITIHRPIRPHLFRQTCCFTGTILHFTTPYGLGHFRSLTLILYMYTCVRYRCGSL